MLDSTTICSAWGLPPVLSIRPAETGTVHQAFLLDISDGSRYVLRAYHYTAEERERIVQEHTLSAFVRDHGLPAIAPLPLSTGGTILVYQERFYALFPFAAGSQVPRGQLAGREVAAMGRFLGELHGILWEYPHTPLSWRSWEADRAALVARLDTVIQAIREREQPDESDLQVHSLLTQRRAWLLATQPVDVEVLWQLETQLIHGDYQETNLFFTDGRVSAIIDWDQAYIAPRAWEVLRTLHYAVNLDPLFCRIFLEAYHQVQPLSLEELDIAAQVYGWMQAHHLWVYEEFYLRGNARVRTLRESHEKFVPFVGHWAVIREELTR